MTEVVFALGLSGLQDFVYDVEAEDAARRLRIRSAILTLAPAVVAARLRKTENTSTQDPYYLGGGQLLTLATQDGVESLQEQLQQLERWLFLHSAGSLGIHWTSVPATGNEQHDVSCALAALATAKWQTGRHEGHWLDLSEHLFPFEVSEQALGNKDWEAEAGRELVRAGGPSGFRVDHAGSGWPIGPWTVAPLSQGHTDVSIQSSPDDTGVTIGLPRHVPMHHSGDIMTLEDIANSGTGAPYLAALKLDGDRIGKSMADALGTSIENYQKRSRALRAFFAVTIPKLLSSDFPNVYLIYSGGDDLAAVGHFHDILTATLRIAEAYRKADLGTLSAAIAAFHMRTPVRSIMDVANDLLERHAKKRRNKVCVFGQTLSWEQLELVVSEAGELAAHVRRDSHSLPRGMLQLLRRLQSLYTSEIPVLERVHFRALPLIHYFRERRLGHAQLSDAIKKLLFDLQGGHDPVWERIGLVAMIAAWLTKSQENDA